jgi:hypothetical protein
MIFNKRAGARRALEYMPPAWAQGMLRLFAPWEHQRLMRLHDGSSPSGSLQPFHERQAIFVHIPKCAGVSVATGLFGGFVGHWTLAYYRMVFDPADFKRYFKFSFVRNPYDRLVSAYHYMLEPTRRPDDRAWADCHLRAYADFDDFVRRGLRTWSVQAFLLFNPQMDYLRLPWRRGSQVDLVGRVESLDQDYGLVARRLGLPPALSKLNVGVRRERDYRPYYSPATRRIVEKVYADDFKAFDYGF